MAFPSSLGVSVAFHPSHPAELFEYILAVIPPEHRRRALSLGAGTGNWLLPYFNELIAVERDQFEQEPRSIDLITVDAALCGMDIPRMIENVARWLRPAGILAIWAVGLPRTPDPAQAITRQEFADRWNRFRDPRLDLAESADHARRAATGFTILEERTIPHIVWLTPHELVGFWRSTSYASTYARQLAVPEAYWHDLEERYRLAWPRTKIPVDFSPWLLLARRD